MADSDEDKRASDVGYKKPPKSTQFKNGHPYYPPHESRRGHEDGLSMTEAVNKTVVVKDAYGKKRKSKMGAVINATTAAKAAKGDIRAAETVFRQLEREKARYKTASDSAGGHAKTEPHEKARMTYNRVLFDFAHGMREVNYQKLCDLGNGDPTDDECMKKALIDMLTDYKVNPQKYVEEVEYRMFISMICALQGLRCKPHIQLPDFGKELLAQAKFAHENRRNNDEQFSHPATK